MEATSFPSAAAGLAGLDANSFLSFCGSPTSPTPTSSWARNYSGEPTSLSGSAAPVHIQPSPDSPAPESPFPRCAGLEFANMKKEKAREEYKEKRRVELLQLGEVDRVKRRKKNDTSMSENQKYHRRLKMNQDSAAAARHAQDIYVQTLEELVATGEKEKLVLAMEASQLRSERDELARRLGTVENEVVAAVPLVADAHIPDEKDLPMSFADEPPLAFEEPNEPSNSAMLLRKMIELFETPETASAMQNDSNFARGLFGIMPAPAV